MFLRAVSLAPRRHAITSCAKPLQAAIKHGFFDSPELTDVPVAMFYDLDLWDNHLAGCKAAFGDTFTHYLAIKSCSISKMLVHAHAQGFGIECASMGEIKHAQDHCQVPTDMIVFDSPAKTRKELEYGLQERIHTNLDNFVEYDRAKQYIEAQSIGDSSGPVGFRINPLVGAGEIAALSVSTSDSKFGMPISDKEALLKCYRESPWMNSVHVHVGSGGMGVMVLGAGIRVAVDFANEINTMVGRKQVEYIDVGGGLPANFAGDEWAAEKIPTFEEYATHLRETVPELFSGEYKVMTEFGQSLFAKSGFLASRIEWMKGTAENPIAIIHFGADCAPRQIYTNEHKRRVEAYRADGTSFADAHSRQMSVGGPLCFQGDFVAKDISLPAAVAGDDIIVMKDAGSNTLSMFSKHCSRLCPPVYGYRWTDAGEGSDGEIKEIVELKPRESLDQLYDFWGRLPPN